MAFVGMEISEVTTLATLLNRKAEDIDSICKELTSKLSGTHWEGNDAKRFREEWQGQHVKALHTVIQALKAAAAAANKNVQEQEAASR